MYSQFEKYGLTRADFITDTYRSTETTGTLTHDISTFEGVSVKIKSFQIGVSSHGERSQILNLHKCLTMLMAIIKDMCEEV